ncbi:MAG: hemolysin III family protein [Saprospiraceae bacterium]|nr:hemolysin III family protein [Saprospiraceae bacterium]
MIRNWPHLPVTEKLNVSTHAIGLILAMIGTPLLLIEASIDNDGVVFWCLFIFIVGMVGMYLSSTFYHLALNPEFKKTLRKVDHIAIFGLIGGTYTPFISIYYNKDLGWIFLFILWGIILIGMITKIFRIGKNKILSSILYLILGWMVVLIYKPITSDMSDLVFNWLVIGGLSYTLGVFFYLWKQLKYHHAVWHLFVLGGTFSHFLSIYFSL